MPVIHHCKLIIPSCYVLGRRSGLRLSARRIKHSTKTRTGQRRRLVRKNSEQLSTIDFDTHVEYEP